MNDMTKTMRCSELEEDTPVVFKVDPYHKGKKKIFDGTVVYVHKTNRKICVSYLYGYQNFHDNIPYEDMIAAYDENGEMIRFENVSGRSVLLIPE